MFNKMILIVVLFGVSFSSIFCQLKKLTSSNLKTETEIYIDSRGNWWSNIVRIHFAQKSIDQEAKSKFASTSDILQPQIRKIFKDIEKKYGKFILQKTFTNSFWGDTIGVHVTTK